MPIPAIRDWSRSTPLIWERPAAARISWNELGREVLEGIRAEAGHRRHVRGVAHDVDGQPLLGARLGDVHGGDRRSRWLPVGPAGVARREHDAQGQRRTRAPPRPASAERGGRGGRVVAPAGPSGPGQVDDHVQRLTLGIDQLEDQVLAQPGEAEHLAAGHRADRVGRTS